MTGATVAALTLYDMLKMIDETLSIGSITLKEKRGGKTDFRKVDPSRRLEVVEGEEDFLGDLEFSFDGEDAGGSDNLPDNQITEVQMSVYPFVNGKDSVNEIILESTLIEFETCKALAELLDRVPTRHRRFLVRGEIPQPA